MTTNQNNDDYGRAALDTILAPAVVAIEEPTILTVEQRAAVRRMLSNVRGAPLGGTRVETVEALLEALGDVITYNNMFCTRMVQAEEQSVALRSERAAFGRFLNAALEAGK